MIICSLSSSSPSITLALSHHDSSTVIKFLPGFSGPLPFYFETGYIGVDENEDVQLFYYFVHSERNATEDPVLLWLTGGPGCSAFSGLVFEIGPLKFDVVENRGSLPTLVQNPYSWTKVASIIFLDSPVGTGFSYSSSSQGWMTNDLKSSTQAFQFLKKWLINHPKFRSNPIYIGGDSYSGKIVPVVVQDISDGNEAGDKPYINIKGYILGNPVTVPSIEGNTEIPYAYGMGLLSEELYQSLKKNCEGEYKNINPRNILCQQDLISYSECISGINTAHILEPVCLYASPNPKNTKIYRRSIAENLKQLNYPNKPIAFEQEPPSPSLECRSYGYLLSYYWMNDKRVRKTLRIRKGTIQNWQRCNYGLKYRVDVESSFIYHVTLSKRGYRSLIYSGDHDMVVPHLGTQAWIRLLNYSIVDNWRSWSIDGQVGGYTRKYSNDMTFATVKGGGHTAPEYKPKEALTMFKRWIDNEGL